MDNNHAVVQIRDDGVGIRKDHLNKIFDPFFTTREVGQGSGLGLTVCYGIIEHHHGSIGLKSEVGQGTTVTISLPVKQA